MNREELITRLDLLISESRITLEEAERILSLYDRGLFDESALPLTREQERELLFVGVSTAGALALLLSARRRTQRFTELRFSISDVYEERILPFSAPFLDADPNVGLWHRSLGAAIRDNAYAMSEAGAGRKLFENEIRIVENSIARQAGYLERFADEVAFRNIIGRPLSEKQIRDRSRQYAGFGIGLFYQLAEQQFVNLRGYVANYIPVDDAGTCIPCHNAGIDSPYLPGQGPMPGIICVARGKCRCHRQIVFNLREYERLAR